MREAVAALEPKPEYLLIDGKYPIKHPLPQLQLCGGDRKCTSIAAASIIAKVLRDRIMELYGDFFPNTASDRTKDTAPKPTSPR